MPVDQKRGTALLIGAAVSIAALSGNVRAEESRTQPTTQNQAQPFVKMAQVRVQQEEEQDEQRRRRRRDDDGNQEGRGQAQGQGNQQEEGGRRRRGDAGDDNQRGGGEEPRRGRQEQREERRNQAEGERRQRQERREQAEEQRDQRQERRGDQRENLKERVQERVQERRENARERQENRQERREDARDRQENRQERRQERREGAREERREELQGRRREIEERRRERAERRSGNREEARERRQEREEFSRRRLKDITRERRETRQGGRVILEEPGGRRIVRENGRAIIRHDELARFRDGGRDFREERTRRGHNRRIVTRPNGVQIITVVDENGRLIRRVKRLPNGRRVVLFNNERREGRRRGGRDRDGGFSFYIDLSPPRINIPREEYYLYADRASEADIYEALSAPPVEDLEESYTLDEVLYNRSVRNRMRTVNLNTINFEFGSWEIGEGQIDRLADVADAILSIVEKNPNEVVLVAGYTDAVGSDEDNLSLSDRRAETVARVLTDEFNVPPENLVTQGYGEQDLLVNTQTAEVQNRRVEFQRVTPLLAQNESAED